MPVEVAVVVVVVAAAVIWIKVLKINVVSTIVKIFTAMVLMPISHSKLMTLGRKIIHLKNESDVMKIRLLDLSLHRTYYKL